MDTNIPFVLLVVFAVVLVFFVLKLCHRRTLARLKHTLLEQLDTSKACKVGEALKRLQTLERLIGEGRFHELYIRSTEVHRFRNLDGAVDCRLQAEGDPVGAQVHSLLGRRGRRGQEHGRCKNQKYFRTHDANLHSKAVEPQFS